MVHDTVMRELTILAAQHHRLFRSYHELALALRKQHSCDTMQSIERSVSRAIETANEMRVAKPSQRG